MLARMDEGALQGEPVELSLSKLLARSLEEFSQPMEAKGLKLAADIPPDVVIRGDLEQIRKHADQGGSITVSLMKTDSRIKLRIENTCPALPDVPPDKLFDRFYRADSARTQKSGGYGIGLSVARSLAAANRAVISAKYIQPDIVRFTVRFRQ